MVRRFVGLVGGLALLAIAGAVPCTADELKGDPGRGAKFWADNCGRCHNPRPPSDHRDREWSLIITHMRVQAGLPGAQARDIEAFLRMANNPPRPASKAGR